MQLGEETVTSSDSPSRSEPAKTGISPKNPGTELQLNPQSQQADTEHESKTLVGLSGDVQLVDAQISIGDKVGKYEIRAKLGAGGMGAVYLAFDPLIEREVALKVLSPELGNSSAALQRFLGEARAIGRLNHPHVVSIYDIDLWNGQYYLVMELLSGGSVGEKVDEGGPLPWQEACRIIAEAAAGLAAAHSAGMIHRDIKPENLMLTKEGSVKVVDFGLSKLLDASHDPQTAVTKQGQILGTPQYMSPEQFESSDVDSRTDIYSLGGTLFRLLTARFPYDDSRSILQIMTSHLSKPPPLPTEFLATVPKDCDRIVAKAMAKNLADRYQTAAELADALQALLDGPAVAAPAAVANQPLLKALIVEPSKMQGAMLKDALSHAGARSVHVLPSLDAARQAVGKESPDLLITAMELPDGRGIDLLQDLSRQARLERTTVVLNSSDSTIAELTAVGSAACLILAPKKVRAEEILRVAHAAGPCLVQSGPLAAPFDPAALRLRIAMDSGRIPDLLADMIRDLQLLDVEVSGMSAAAPGSQPPNLTLAVTREHQADDSAAFAALASSLAESGSMTAAVELEGGKLLLRAVNRNGVVAVCRRVLDASRLACLLQGCRP